MRSHTDTLEFIQRGRETKRYHTHPMLDNQRIDAHSFGVAMFTWALVPVASPERRSRLLMAALVHDLAEHHTGDIPAPTKRKLGLREQFGGYEDALLQEHAMFVDLDAADARVLKLADNADGALHCIRDYMMGNKYAAEPYHNFFRYLIEEQGLGEIGRAVEAGEQTVRRYIERQWSAANPQPPRSTYYAD